MSASFLARLPIYHAALERTDAMTPGRVSEYLANAHRHDLLREARQAALAAEATSENGGIWTAALLVVADLLVHAGQQLHAHLAHERRAHAHSTLCTVVGKCPRDDTLRERVAWLDG